MVFLQAAFAFRTSQRRDEFGERAEVDTPSGFHGLDSRRGSRWIFPVPGWAKEVDDLRTGNEAELVSAKIRSRSSEGWKEKSKRARS